MLKSIRREIFLSISVILIIIINLFIHFNDKKEIDEQTKNNIIVLEKNLNEAKNDFLYTTKFNLKLEKYNGVLINKYNFPITIQSVVSTTDEMQKLKKQEKITFKDIKKLTNHINKKYDLDYKSYDYSLNKNNSL